jgi:hypothetical protein
MKDQEYWLGLGAAAIVAWFVCKQHEKRHTGLGQGTGIHPVTYAQSSTYPMPDWSS